MSLPSMITCFEVNAIQGDKVCTSKECSRLNVLHIRADAIYPIGVRHAPSVPGQCVVDTLLQTKLFRLGEVRMVWVTRL